MFALAQLSLVKEIIQPTKAMLAQKQTLLIGSALGLLAVLLGAFGAHALKDILSAHGRVETYELAVRYHFYHSLAMLAVGLLMDKFPSSILKVSALLLLIGTLLFSGSLYLLSLLNVSAIAIVTPFGGLFLMAGWSTLFMAVLRSVKN